MNLTILNNCADDLDKQSLQVQIKQEISKSVRTPYIIKCDFSSNYPMLTLKFTI